MSLSVGPSVHGGTTTYDVFVGNLPVDTNREKVQAYFEPFGEIHSVLVRDTNRDGMDCKLSFVRFLDEKNAQKACQEANGGDFQGCKILVKRSEVKKRPLINQSQTTGMGGGGDGMKPRDRQSYNNTTLDRQNYNNTNTNRGPPKMIGEKPDLVKMGRQPQISHWQSSSSTSSDTPSPEPLRTEQMIISYIDGPNSFWGQLIQGNKAQELVKLSEDLAAVCPTSSPLTGRPNFSKIYGALFSEDGQWYRCKPLSYVSETKTLVQYVDYGNSEIVENDKIVEVPNTLLSVDAHAMKYVFNGMELVVDDPESDNYKQAVNYLKDVTDGKLITTTVHGPDAVSTATAVDLSYEDSNIAESMVQKGYLKKKSSEHNYLKAPRNVPNQGQGDSKPMPQRHERVQNPKGGYPQQNTVPPLMGITASNWGDEPEWGGAGPAAPPVSHQQLQNAGGWGQPPPIPQPMQPPPQQQAPPPVQPQQQMPVQNRQPPPQQTNQMPRGGMNQVQDRNVKIRNELQGKLERANREIMKLQSDFTRAVAEKDAAVLELGTMKGRMKLIQEECANVSRRATEANISHKLKRLMATVNKVKLMRIQFPTDNSSPDLIQMAIELVQATDVKIRPDMELISNVQQALSDYNNCQKQIRFCQDQSTLPNLISDRNSSRKVLYEKLEGFLEKTKRLPILARGNALRESINHLKLTYSTFKIGMTAPEAPLEEVIKMYQEWRSRKNSLYSDVRTQTNTSHNMVDSALKAMQELLSLDFIVMPESKIAPPDLDSLVNRLQTAVAREMQMSDLEKSGDAPLVARTLTYLINDMMAEMKNIDQLAAMKSAYSDLKSSLVNWLDDKPDLMPVQTIRKNFKSLKSKLRHKLADKHDLEESDEDQEDLEKVNMELAQIRMETHAAFLAEDEQMEILAELFRDHFPELTLEHPEFYIDKYVEYGGLVKSGLDVDQFDLQPLPGTDKSSVYLTMFNNERAVLKEFIIDDTMGITREEFLSRAIAYNSVKSDFLLKIQAIFFHKNQRQAFLLFKHHRTLISRLQEGKISEEEVHRCLTGVLKGLAALHDTNLIHGVIKSENILLDSEGNGILADFDFTKTVDQRACNLHMINTGLIFNAPETRVGLELTKATDIFSFGVLFVMMHFPTRSFQTAQNGVPIVAGTRWPPQMIVMVENLLSVMPNSRISSKDLLTMPYFTMPCVPKECTEVKDVLQLNRGKSPLPTLEEQPLEAENSEPQETIVTSPEKVDAISTPLPDSDNEELADDNQPVYEDMPELDESKDDESNVEVVENEGLSQAIPDVVTQAADMPILTSSSTDDDCEDGVETKEVSEIVEMPQLEAEEVKDDDDDE